jgi:hypothetical protein
MMVIVIAGGGIRSAKKTTLERRRYGINKANPTSDLVCRWVKTKHNDASNIARPMPIQLPFPWVGLGRVLVYR